MFQVQHSFRPSRDHLDTDLDLHIGDILTNVEYLDNGWSIGFNVSTKQAGIFPRRNILPIQDGTSSIFPPSVPKLRPVYTQDRVNEYVDSDEIANWWKAIDTQALREAYRQVVSTERNQFKAIKGAVGFVAGLILGGLAYIGFQFALEYPAEVAGALAGIIGFVLIIGLAFSTKCRAVVCLCIPTLSTRSGRLMFSTFAMSVLLFGPVTNIANNVAELASVSSCTGELLYNQTAYIREVALQPYEDLVTALEKTVEQVQQSTSVITSVLKPINDILDELIELQSFITTELTRAANECRSGLAQAEGSCKDAMEGAAQDCIEFIDAASNSWECGSVSVSNRLECNAGRKSQAYQECQLVLGSSVCSPVIDTAEGACDTIDNDFDFLDFSAELETIRKALDTDITIQDTIEGGVASNASAEDAIVWLKDELDSRTRVITEILTYVNWVLSLSALLVVVQSYIYLRKYLRDDKHDNNYITESFVKVDKKRCNKGKWSLLPLTPKEQKQVADKRAWKLSGIEKKTFCTGFLGIFLTILSGAAVVAFDYLLYDIILLSNQYEGVTIDINEDINVGITVADGGLLSTFLQELIGNLQISSSLDHTIDFSVCAPKGTAPDMFYLVGLGAIYILLVLTILLHAYTVRLRHSMAGYFYPEREKDRVRFLHRKLLRRRVIIVKELKDVLMVKRQDNENKNAVRDLVDDMQSLCCRGKSADKEECYICEEVDYKDELYWCNDCSSYFCNDCFNITLNQKCPCNPNENLTYDHVTDSDFEDDVQEQLVTQYYAYVESGLVRDSNDMIPQEEIPMEPARMRQNQGEFFRRNSRHRASWKYGGRGDM